MSALCGIGHAVAAKLSCQLPACRRAAQRKRLETVQRERHIVCPSLELNTTARNHAPADFLESRRSTDEDHEELE